LKFLKVRRRASPTFDVLAPRLAYSRINIPKPASLRVNKGDLRPPIHQRHLGCGLLTESLHSLDCALELHCRGNISIMFSPVNAVPQSASTRSSRRRQRPLSSESSVSQPKAKRQRSVLSEQTFLAPDTPPEMQEIKVAKAGGTISRREHTRNPQIPRRELAVRGKKAKLSEPSDGSVVLVRYSCRGVLLSPGFLLT
jgi:hypothetical protein